MKALDASRDAKQDVTRLTPQRCLQMEVAISVKKELVLQPGNTGVSRRSRLTRRDWPKKLPREVANSVKEERIDGAAWLQVRHRLEEMIGGANLQTPVKEEMFLANVTQQVEKQIKDAIDKQNAAKALRAAQFNVLSGTWTELDRHSAQSEDASVASVANPAQPAAWPKPAYFRAKNLVKQSGVPRIFWDRALVAWVVNFPTFDSKGKKNGKTNRVFAVKKFLVPGRSESEADAAALEAAKAFHAELVQQGVLSEPKPQEPNFTSEVPGVAWNKREQKWQVQISLKGGKKRIHGGSFTEKAAAEAKALELREQHGLHTACSARRSRLTRRDWPKKLPREVANSVKKERIDGAAWLQVRHRLEEMIGGANLQTPVKEEMFLANVTQQVKKLIEGKKVDAVDSQKAARTLTADALQFNVLSGTWTKFGHHSGQSDDSVVASAVKPAAPPAEWPKPAQFRTHNLVKQSGVPRINWDRTLVAWLVNFPTFDSKGEKNGKASRAFSVQKFTVPGRSEADADVAALEAAKAFHAELVQQGVLSEPKPRDPNFTSEVPGVKWDKRDQKWRVQIHQQGCKRRIPGGTFTEKDAAEAKALQLREQHGLQRQVKPVSTLAEHLADLARLPVFSPKVPHPGVTWDQKRQKWHAQCQVGGVSRNVYIRPKDHSEEELERSFQEAVAWRKKQEKERAKAKRPKARRVKKQRK
eukprot:Skav235789  [mRNA]  locus=scaffold1267:21602:24610:+ [translate_table: standard]